MEKKTMKCMAYTSDMTALYKKSRVKKQVKNLKLVQLTVEHNFFLYKIMVPVLTLFFFFEMDYG